MALEDLQFQPGIVTERSPRGAAPQWKDCDKVRFVDGLPQLLGGWKRYAGNDADTEFLQVQTSFIMPTGTGETTVTVMDPVRSLHEWASLDNQSFIAMGTDYRLLLINLAEQNSAPRTVNDITPVEDSGTLGADPFTTAMGSNIVIVADAAHGLEDRQIVVFDGAAVFNGVTIEGAYMIKKVDANTYWIFVESAASAAGSGGGAAVDYIYEFAPPTDGDAEYDGYGFNSYGTDLPQERGYGTPRYIASGGDTPELQLWSLDNWGEDLIASRRAGPIYVWDKSTGLTTRATLIAAAPDQNNKVLVSPEDRHLISIGSHDDSDRDQMLIRWSDAEDYNQWTPDILTNTAGDKRLDAGSRIITALRTRTEIIIWTDRAMYSMRFDEGGDAIFGFTPLGENVQIIAPQAMAEANGVIYFMGNGDFFIYDGLIRPIPCPIRNHIFDALTQNRFNIQKVVASSNRLFSEVWWHFPADSSDNDRYAIYNYREGLWYYGAMTRTAFHDVGPFLDAPFGFDTEGYLLLHEQGYDDAGGALSAYIESHDFEIASGDGFQHIAKIVPDLVSVAKNVKITLRGKRYPQSDSYTQKGQYTITPTTEKTSLRIRARQISLKIASGGVDNFWRSGTWRAEAIKHGRR